MNAFGDLVRTKYKVYGDAIVTREPLRGYWSGHEICGLRVERNSTGRSCRMLCGLPRLWTAYSANLTILPLLAEDIETRQRRLGIEVVDKRDPLASDRLLWSRRREAVIVVLSRATTVTAAVLHESDSSLWQFLKFLLPSHILLWVYYSYCRYVLVLY